MLAPRPIYTCTDLAQDLNEIFLLENHFLTGDEAIASFSCDSRNIVGGECFIALPGARQDGHDFLEEIFSKGATAAIISEKYSIPENLLNRPLYRVADPLQTLQLLAQKHLVRSNAKVIAVTGSLGKTTTTHLILEMLGERATGTKNNQNTQISLPLTILNGDLQREWFVLEMGMTHSGNISQLIQIAPPTVALITTVSISHGENFNSLEEISAAKSEIFGSSKTQVGILPSEMLGSQKAQNVGSCSKVFFSMVDSKANYFGRLVEVLGDPCMATYENEKLIATIPLPFPGRHNAYNLLATIALLRQIGVEWNKILERISLLTLPPRRMQRNEIGEVVFFDDAYNASSPVAVIAAIDTILEMSVKGKRYAILSEMRELGQWSQQSHQEVYEKAINTLDGILVLGEAWEKFRGVPRPDDFYFEIFLNKEALSQRAAELFHSGDIVLLKGSKKYAMQDILENLRHEKLISK